MKKAIIGLLFLSVIGFFAFKSAPNPAKPYPVSLQVSDWQTILTSLSQSPTISAKSSTDLQQLIISQLTPQIAKDNDTIKPKDAKPVK